MHQKPTNEVLPDAFQRIRTSEDLAPLPKARVHLLKLYAITTTKQALLQASPITTERSQPFAPAILIARLFC
jgi:hypothetical protein